MTEQTPDQTPNVTPDEPAVPDPNLRVEEPDEVPGIQPEDIPIKPIKDYKVGDTVVVLVMKWGGDWYAGFVNDRTEQLLYVQTDRGPATIMSDKYIRPN